MIWRACERLGVRPPDVTDQWNTLDIQTEGYILAYEQIRQIEESERLSLMAKMLCPR